MANNVEIKKLSLADVNSVVDVILDVLFRKSETSDETSYLGQYDEIIRVYFEMNAAFPDLKIHKVDINEFFDRYCDGEYDMYVEVLKNDRRIKYIEDALDNTTENLMKYYAGGQLKNYVAKFVNSLNKVVEKYSDSLDGIGKNDIMGFLKNFAEFTSTNNPESLTEIMLKKKKATPKPKKATQTENKEN